MLSTISYASQWIRSFRRSDEGATAVEYGIMVFLIAVAIILAVTAIGGQLQEVFWDVAEALGFEAAAPG